MIFSLESPSLQSRSNSLTTCNLHWQDIKLEQSIAASALREHQHPRTDASTTPAHTGLE